MLLELVAIMFPPQEKSPNGQMNPKSPQPEKRAKALRILCADDHTMVGDLLVRLFSLAGHAVEHVDNGLDAWEKMSKDIRHFDVLITDHQMPNLNGLELVELLREANYRGRIIVHSGSLSAHEAERYRGFGVDGIVTKGSEAQELLKVVEAFHEFGS